MKVSLNVRVLLLASFCFLQLSVAHAGTDMENKSTAEMPTDNRIARKLGAYIGILGDLSS